MIFNFKNNSKTKFPWFSETGAGFTIVELLIAIAIFVMLVFITMAMLQTVLMGSEQGFLAEGNIDNAILTTSRFVNGVRNASTGIDGSYPLNTAGNNQIIFYSQSPNGSTINKINYYLSGTTLYEQITTPTGNPLSYNPGSTVTDIVQNNVVNSANSPIFLYYDGNYNGGTNPLSQPINVTLVKFVTINLTILNQVKSQSQANFSITTGSAMRNLKTNLGN